MLVLSFLAAVAPIQSARQSNPQESFTIAWLEPVGAGTDSGKQEFVSEFEKILSERDLPASARARVGQGQVSVTLKIDATGKVGSCRPSTPHPLAALMCARAIRMRGPITYIAPGQPIDYAWQLTAKWTTERVASRPRPLPVAPPAPPGRVSREYYGPLRVAELAKFPTLPQGLKDTGVAIDLIIKPDRAEPSCEVTTSYADLVFGSLACDWGRLTRFTYAEPCVRCQNNERFPMVLAVDGGKLSVRTANESLLLRNAPKAPIITFDSSDLASISTQDLRPREAQLSLIVDNEGRATGCAMSNAMFTPLEEAVCKKVSAQRFVPAEDLFGETTTATLRLQLQLP